jgi:hypothetical protein
MILRIKMNVRNFILAMGLAMMLAVALGVIPAFAQQTEPQSPQQPVGAPATDPRDPPDEISTESMFPHFRDTRFWLSGQANFIFQTHPDFHAPYSGPHSLGPRYEKATSRLLTL